MTVTLTYYHTEKGIEIPTRHKYSLVFDKQGNLSNAFNEFGFSVEKGSEAFNRLKTYKAI